MSSDGAIVLEAVEVRYGSHAAVRQVSLQVAPGELHVLLGESGSGKTTLLRAIAGFEAVAAGRIRLHGRVVDDGAGSWVPPERRQVGVVFQDYALFPHLDVAGNVAFGMGRRDRAHAADLLEQVGLAGYGRRPVSDLSGGEQQRVALARTLAQRPRVVLMDEPFSNLNPELRQQLRDASVALLRAEGITAVLVTHDRREAFAVADRISAIREGRLLQTGTARQLYDTPASAEVAQCVGEVNLVPATVAEDGRHADCALGRVALRREADGSNLLLRPEQLRVHTEPGAGCAGRVVSRAYFGAADEVVVAVDGGVEVRATVVPGLVEPEQQVWLDVCGPAVCVP